MRDTLRAIIPAWKNDVGGTYQTWFLWEERLKNFRSIRQGLALVTEEIEARQFGNVYRGSSLETVVGSVAEQRQIFKGADHAFLWKPKLRIPDIYENPENQLAFGRFLKNCLGCSDEDGILCSIREIEARRIKGLGPAAANLLYFLHPTLVPPFNTAIVKGYNLLMGAKVKLGRWDEYLGMRAGILRFNEENRDILSNDLGAAGGLLFDLGSGRYSVPKGTGEEAKQEWEADLKRVREESVAHRKALLREKEADLSHTEVQGWLRDLGSSLGFTVWIASNDRKRDYREGKLGDGCLKELPKSLSSTAAADTIGLIDVLWFEKDGESIVAAFEVEQTTSIYSGILRLFDLALSPAGQRVKGLYLVAPDEREKEVQAQINRPAFQSVKTLAVRYLPYGEFERHRESMARFGEGLKAIEAVARRLF